MDITLVILLIVIVAVLVSMVGFFARLAYRKDTRRLAKQLNLKIGFFGGITGTYRDYDVTIEPGTPLRILVHYRPPYVSPQIMDINLWLLRKGLPLPWDAPTSPDDPEPSPSEKLSGLDPIFDRQFEIWSRPPDFGQQAFKQQQKIGSRLAKSNLQHIEVNWLFTGLSCLTDLRVRGLEADILQRNLDLAIDLAELIQQESTEYLMTHPTGMPMF
jgi:hypothetical protein